MSRHPDGMTADTPSPTISWHPQPFFSHRVETAREIDLLNAEGGIAVRFSPLESDKASFSFEGVQSRSLSLWRTWSRHGFLTVPQIEVDVITIRFVTEGAMLRRDLRREHIGRPGQAMMVMFDAMRSEEASGAFTALSGTVTRQALHTAHVALEGADVQVPLPQFMPVVDVKGLPMHTLMQTMNRIHRQLKAGVHESDLVFPLLEEILSYQILTAWPREDHLAVPLRSGATSSPLARAKDYIEAHLGEKVLLSDIAAAAGVGVRSLQQIFRSQMGKTPIQYLLEQRLDRVRADLRESSDSGILVATIATRWGFTHMGDFGRRYSARFGERPSVTKRR